MTTEEYEQERCSILAAEYALVERADNAGVTLMCGLQSKRPKHLHLEATTTAQTVELEEKARQISALNLAVADLEEERDLLKAMVASLKRMAPPRTRRLQQRVERPHVAEAVAEAVAETKAKAEVAAAAIRAGPHTP